uniref:Uncharacterized protein n=1 Tax=Anguilla anguilla TaxID=7936 RepID=A0A0E9U580_ANGAN
MVASTIGSSAKHVHQMSETCGSSRTEQDYYCNNTYISRVKLTCLTTV